MRAYYYDNLEGDQRLPHDYVPSRPVSVEKLKTLGVKFWTIPVEGYETEIDRLAAQEGYKNRDMINVSKEGLGDLYETKMKGFFEEHMHEDEEIRYVLSGRGFFDVRGKLIRYLIVIIAGLADRDKETPSDSWIRIAVQPGDLLVVPEGIYHRFTLDMTNNIRALRLFKDEPKWIPYNRSADTDINPHRLGYLKSIGVSA